MPLRSLITRSIDPQPTSRRLSRAFAATAAKPYEDYEYVDRFRSWNFFGWLDLAHNDPCPESGWKWKFLCRSDKPNWCLFVHIQSLKQPNFGHGSDLTAAASAVRKASAVHRSAKCDEANVDSRGATFADLQSDQLDHRFDGIFDYLNALNIAVICTLQSSSTFLTLKSSSKILTFCANARVKSHQNRFSIPPSHKLRTKLIRKKTTTRELKTQHNRNFIYQKKSTQVKQARHMCQ